MGGIPSSFGQDNVDDVGGGVFDPLVSQEEAVKGAMSFGTVGQAKASYYDSPNKQTASGLYPHEVGCASDKTLIVRHNGKPACVTPGTATGWEDVGLGRTSPLLGCKEGAVHLKNPNTNAIICENQSQAEKYITQGWVALDKVPTPDDPFLPTANLTQCKGGEIHLENERLGTIICENQDQAQKYINEGWVAIDHVPEHDDTGLTKCSGGHIPMSGSATGSPVCVLQDKVQKYTAQGFTPLEDVQSKGDFRMSNLKECKGGSFHLKNPNTGAIICERQDQAKKYMNEGWEALDDITTQAPGQACKTGEVNLKNPGTGAIICEKQSDAKQYTDQGWVIVNP